MNANARISAMEAKVAALMLVIEKQNDTITALTSRVDALEKAPSVASKSEYVPQFTQWPGNGR